MARPRTGSLIRRKSGWFARVRLTEDGTSVRRMVDLETTNRRVAKQKLDRILAAEAAQEPAKVRAAVKAGLTVADAVKQAHEQWEADGLRTADECRDLLKRWALSSLGTLDVSTVRPADIRGVLDAVRDAGRKRGTVVHVKNALSSVFGGLWRDETIAENPVARVRVPKMTEVRKERAVLTDDELGIYLAWRHPDDRRKAQDLARDDRVVALAGHGGAREQGSDATLTDRGATYLVRRLKRDAPDIAEALARGEYPSARAAAIAAGIVKVPTLYERALRLVQRLSREEWVQLRSEVDG